MKTCSMFASTSLSLALASSALGAGTGIEDSRKAAWDRFHQACDKTAGVKIFKTIPDVRSVVLLKARPHVSPGRRELYDQFWKGDQYAGIHIGPLESNWDALWTLVANMEKNNKAFHRNVVGPEYSFFEAPSSDGSWWKYESKKSDPEKPIRTAIEKPVSRYAIDWEDISTAEDQRYWISASRWRIIDLQTHEVLGERIGYLIEPGFGSRAQARQPWLVARMGANSCPPVRDLSNAAFISKVLVPFKGTNQNRGEN